MGRASKGAAVNPWAICARPSFCAVRKMPTAAARSAVASLPVQASLKAAVIAGVSNITSGAQIRRGMSAAPEGGVRVLSGVNLEPSAAKALRCALNHDDTVVADRSNGEATFVRAIVAQTEDTAGPTETGTLGQGRTG